MTEEKKEDASSYPNISTAAEDANVGIRTEACMQLKCELLFHQHGCRDESSISAKCQKCHRHSNSSEQPPRVLWSRQRFFGRVALLLLSLHLSHLSGRPLDCLVGSDEKVKRRRYERSLLVASSPTPTRQNHIIFNGKYGPTSNLSSLTLQAATTFLFLYQAGS